MAWYIEISATSLSEEAKRICKLNGIFKLDELVERYREDAQLSGLKESTETIRKEIRQFAGETLQYFAGMNPVVKVKKTEKPERLPEPEEVKTPARQIVENLSIKQLLEKGWIDRRLFNICEDNGISDLLGIFREYKKRDTFQHFRNAGLIVDKTVVRLLNDLEVKDHPTEEIKVERVRDKQTHANSFEAFIKSLEKKEYSRSLREIKVFFNLEEEALFHSLCQLYLSVERLGGVGKQKTDQAQWLISRYFEKHLQDNTAGKQFARALPKIKNSYFAVHEDLLWKHYTGSAYSLLYYLFVSYTKFRWEDFVYLNQFLCFYKESVFHSYEDLVALFEKEFAEETNSSTVRVHINRVRKKLETLFSTASDIFGEEYFMEAFGIDKKVPYFIVSDEFLEEANRELPKEVSKEFFRYAFRSLFNQRWSDIRDGKSVRTSLNDTAVYLVRNDIAKWIRKAMDTINETYNRVRRQEEAYGLKDFFAEQPDADSQSLLAALIKLEYEGVLLAGDQIKFLPNAEARKRAEHYLFELFKEYETDKTPLDYNDIVEEYDRRHPGIRTSHRSLRDAMHQSDKFLALGGRSNKYILREWEEAIVTGPNKELVINFYHSKKDSAHFYEVYKGVKKVRGDIRLSTLTALLANFDFFINERGGYYYFQDHPPRTANKFVKSINSLRKSLDEISREDLLEEKETVIEILLEKHPDFSGIQIEYAVDREAGIIDI